MRAQALGKAWREVKENPMQSNGYDHWTLEESCLLLALILQVMAPWAAASPSFPQRQRHWHWTQSPCQDLSTLQRGREEFLSLTKQQGGNDLNSIREEFQPLCDHQALLCINLIWKEWQCQGPGPYNSGMPWTRAVV